MMMLQNIQGIEGRYINYLIKALFSSIGISIISYRFKLVNIFIFSSFQ
jgi:hypothetical protein